MFAVINVLLNEPGLFKVKRVVMVTGAAIALASFLIPLIVFAISKRKRGAVGAAEQEWFHKLIIFSVFFGIGAICVALSMHTVLLLAIPPLIAAQYRLRKKEFAAVLAATILLVPVGVYGGFFFGTPDRNLLKGLATGAELHSFASRLTLVTPKRMREICLHYVLPRLLSILAIDVLAYGITSRNGRMFDKQLALSEKVREEMETRHRMQDHVIEVLANLIETRDAGTGKHIIRTKSYVEMIAAAMRRDPKYAPILTDEYIERMKSAAPLHDVGKISIPDSILLKPGKLTKEEFEIMKTHAPIGGEIIKKLFSGMDELSFLDMAEEIAASHHERWDGTGYPGGLKGEEIPLSARIMAVADVYDALVSVRVYKDAISPKDALGIIYEESGTHFDPDIIRIVRGIESELIAAAEGK